MVILVKSNKNLIQTKKTKKNSEHNGCGGSPPKLWCDFTTQYWWELACAHGSDALPGGRSWVRAGHRSIVAAEGGDLRRFRTPRRKGHHPIPDSFSLNEIHEAFPDNKIYFVSTGSGCIDRTAAMMARVSNSHSRYSSFCSPCSIQASGIPRRVICAV